MKSRLLETIPSLMHLGRLARWSLAAALVLAGATFMPTPARATVTELALWPLGDGCALWPQGTMVAGKPQDMVGGHHFLNIHQPSGSQSPTTPAPIPTSVAANSFSPVFGHFGCAPGTTTIPTDNFAIEI